MIRFDTDNTHEGWEAQQGLVNTRRKCLKSFKSNTRVFDDFSTSSSIPISSQLANLLGIVNQCFATNLTTRNPQRL